MIMNNLNIDFKYAIEHGIIDYADVWEKSENMKRTEYLEKHPHPITLGKDGYWRTYLPLPDGTRKQVKKKKEKDIQDAVIDFWKEQEENPTIREVFEEWNNRRLRLNKIGESTHLRNIQVYNRHYYKFGSRKIKSIDAEQMQEFLEEQIAEHDLTAKGYYNLKTITRGFLKHAKRKHLIEFSIEDAIDGADISKNDFKIVIKEDEQEVFSESEYPIMINYLIENIDIHNLGILFMFVTGMRVGELVALKYEDFTEDKVACFVRRTETRYKKDGQYVLEIKDRPKTQAGIREVVIPEGYQWIYKELRKMNPFGEYVFMKNGERLSAQSIRMSMKRICSKLQIYPKPPHKARKTYVTIARDNNVPEKVITDQVGHTSISCTDKYYYRNRKTIQTKVNILSNVAEFKAM